MIYHELDLDRDRFELRRNIRLSASSIHCRKPHCQLIRYLVLQDSFVCQELKVPVLVNQPTESTNNILDCTQLYKLEKLKLTFEIVTVGAPRVMKLEWITFLP